MPRSALSSRCCLWTRGGAGWSELGPGREAAPRGLLSAGVHTQLLCFSFQLFSLSSVAQANRFTSQPQFPHP